MEWLPKFEYFERKNGCCLHEGQLLAICREPELMSWADEDTPYDMFKTLAMDSTEEYYEVWFQLDIRNKESILDYDHPYAVYPVHRRRKLQA